MTAESPKAPPARRSALDGLLRRLGVVPGPFRALAYAFAVMDFRNQQFAGVSRAKPADAFTPLFWVMGQNLLTCGVLSIVLFARVDTYFFVLVSLATSMLVTLTSLIVEYDEAVLDPQDLEVIGHLPVPVRTYSAARVGNLMIYLLLVIASMNVFPAIAALGHRDTTWLYLPAYVAATLVANLLVAGLVVLVYTWFLGGRPGTAAREVLAWTQVVLILLFVYGGQAIFRDSANRLEMAAYQVPWWVVYTPPGWLAHFVDRASAGALAAPWWILGATAAGTLAVWAAAIWRLSVAYARMQPGTTAWRRIVLRPLPAPGELAGPVVRALTRSGEERTTFWLCWTMLRRDAALRMRVWPMLGTVIAVLCLGLFSGQLGDPLTERGPAPVMSLACIYLLALPMPTIVHNLQFSRDHAAAWVLASAPLSDGAALAEGLRRAVTYRVLLPMLLVLGVVFVFQWGDALSAALHVGVGWLVVVAGGYAGTLGALKRLPFSAPVARGESFGPIAPLSAAVSAGALLLAAMHYQVATSPGALAGYLAGLVMVVLILRRSARRAVARRFAAGIAYAPE